MYTFLYRKIYSFLKSRKKVYDAEFNSIGLVFFIQLIHVFLLTKIIGLNIFNSQIDFIDYFPDLKILVMNGSIENLKYSEFSQLSELYLEENNISNLDFLESFTSLEILEVRHNNLSDISILSKLSHLMLLDMA